MNNNMVATVMAIPAHRSDPPEELRYTNIQMISNGSFGGMRQATLCNNGGLITIKKILLDGETMNREFEVMRKLQHGNVVQFKYFFYSTGANAALLKCSEDNEDYDKRMLKGNEIYLNLVLEHLPSTVYRLAQDHVKSQQVIPMFYIKLYLYQLFQGLAYIHSQGVCHGNIHPQNLLLNPDTGALKISDFSNATMVTTKDSNIPLVGSLHYQAPEVILGLNNYTVQVDIWSAGCVLVELVLGKPVFSGDSAEDLFVEMIKVMGTPAQEQMRGMGINCTELSLPQINAHAWNTVYKIKKASFLSRKCFPVDAMELVGLLLDYNPCCRASPLQACVHIFFNELREATTKLPNGLNLPSLFNLSAHKMSIETQLNTHTIPEMADVFSSIGNGTSFVTVDTADTSSISGSIRGESLGNGCTTGAATDCGSALGRSTASALESTSSGSPPDRSSVGRTSSNGSPNTGLTGGSPDSAIQVVEFAGFLLGDSSSGESPSSGSGGSGYSGVPSPVLEPTGCGFPIGGSPLVSSIDGSPTSTSTSESPSGRCPGNVSLMSGSSVIGPSVNCSTVGQSPAGLSPGSISHSNHSALGCSAGGRSSGDDSFVGVSHAIVSPSGRSPGYVSTISDPSVIGPSVNGSTIGNSSGGESSRGRSPSNGSVHCRSLVVRTSSNNTNGGGSHANTSSIIGSSVSGSEVFNSKVSYSKIVNSTVIHSTVIQSTVGDSTIQGSSVNNSVIGGLPAFVSIINGSVGGSS